VLVHLEKAQVHIIDQLTKQGVFKTKSEAIRAGINQLGKDYWVVRKMDAEERRLVERKINQEISDMRRKKLRYLTEEEALSKYKALR
jgi:Arc/MetJ-type ribon-helix-helix transcriptional regulator